MGEEAPEEYELGCGGGEHERVMEWEAGLPGADELTPLSQPLVPTGLAAAFRIPPEPGRTLLDVHRASAATVSRLRRASSSSSSSFPAFASKGAGADEAESGGGGAGAGAGAEGGNGNNNNNNNNNNGHNNSSSSKKARLVWTPQLHKRFVEVVAHLGMKNAVPKTIMQLMNVEGLTRENVASHLQKYRLYVKRMQGLSNEGPSPSDHIFASTPVPQAALHDHQLPICREKKKGKGALTDMAVLSSSSHGLLLHHRHPPLRLLAAAVTTATSGGSYSIPHVRLRLAVTTSRLASPISSSPDPPPDVAHDDEHEEGHHKEERDERYGFEIQVRKLAKRNRRLVRARVSVDAPLEAVWATLTDYEGLADFIPGLSECRLLDQAHSFARLYQVGEQDLALGFKFNAKGTIDCYEGEMQLLPAGARRREIAFNMIDGDFKVFEGKWSVQEVDGGEKSADQEFQTALSYVVELEPKLWVPVRLLEGRICNEIKTNLVSIREEAQRIQRLQDKVIVNKGVAQFLFQHARVN